MCTYSNFYMTVTFILTLVVADRTADSLITFHCLRQATCHVTNKLFPPSFFCIKFLLLYSPSWWAGRDPKVRGWVTWRGWEHCPTSPWYNRSDQEAKLCQVLPRRLQYNGECTLCSVLSRYVKGAAIKIPSELRTRRIILHAQKM
jgi:hypothetical protein